MLSDAELDQLSTIAAIALTGQSSNAQIAPSPGGPNAGKLGHSSLRLLIMTRDPAGAGTSAGIGSGTAAGMSGMSGMSGTGQGWRIQSMQRFDVGQSEAVAEALSRAGAGLVLRLVPGLESVARIVPLPEDLAEESNTGRLASALSLLAEGELPAALPGFRRAAGLLAHAPGRITQGGLGRSVLLVGWTSPVVPGVGPRSPWPCSELWGTEPVALAGLAAALTLAPGDHAASSGSGSAGSGRVVSYAQSAAFSSSDQSAGARSAGAASAGVNGRGVSVLAIGPDKSLVRVLRLSANVGPLAVDRVIEETAAAAGCSMPASGTRAFGGHSASAQPLGIFPAPALPVRILGKAFSAEELQEFGLLAGMLQAFASPDTLRPLLSLSEREPRQRATLLERTVRWFGHPARALPVLAACVALLVCVPIGVAYAKYSALRDQAASDPDLSKRLIDSERSLAFVKLLREKRWPMTKLISDVAGAAPVGVTLDALEINATDATLIVRGSADSSDLVTTLRENLNKTRIFSQVTTPTISTGPAGGGLGSNSNADNPAPASTQFQLTAKVAPGAAGFSAKPANDFAASTLVERLYGEKSGVASDRPKRSRASKAGANRPVGPSAATNNQGRTPNPRNSSNPSTAASSGSPATSTAGKPEVPAPLDESKLAKMNATEAMGEFSKRRRASTQQGLDEPTRTRLTAEAEKAKARMQAAAAEAPAVKPAAPAPAAAPVPASGNAAPAASTTSGGAK